MIPYVALFSWPVVSAVFFQRLGAPLAVIVTILAGYLLLPEKAGIDLPLLPEFNKNTIPALAALLFAFLIVTRPRQDLPVLQGLMPKSWSFRILFVVLLAGAFMTVMTNPDPLVFETKVLPGLRPYDAFSHILSTLMFLIPMFLARKFLASPEAHRMLLTALCIAGLAYAFLILFEVRMSPQLHRMVYGYFPHIFSQHIRGGGGWRPAVFLSHGLLVGIFMCFAVLAAAGLVKADKHRRGLYVLATVWLFIVLILSKNLGALAITIVLLAVIFLSSVRVHMIAAATICSIFLIYPAMRSADIVPTDRIVAGFAKVDAERARSLEFRIKHEDELLGKALERPLFGWGGWARNQLHTEQGVNVSVTDGAWTIILGVSGWVGYVTQFGLLILPVFFLFWHRKRYQIGPETSVLALLLTANLVDLIPNASLTPLLWLLAGALWGRVELARAGAPQEDAAVAAAGQDGGAPGRVVPGRTRDFPALAQTADARPGYSRQTTRFDRPRARGKYRA